MATGSKTTTIKMHLSLNVSDLARSVAFYEAFLGVPPHKVRPGYANFDLAEPPLKLALNEHRWAPETARSAQPGPLSHLGFQVATAAQVLATKERLQAAGLATFDETDTTCCYARQDKIWAHDPDGNAWEIYVLTDDLLEDHEHDHAGNPLPMGGTAPSPALSIPSPLPIAAEGTAGGPRCCPDASPLSP
jgi:catechol 2,3-dioxygenase-like lactoylglutathione lyase family enzyme